VRRAKRSERPTVPPSFDVARYAKDSDARLGVARPAQPESETASAAWSEVRLVTRPHSDPVATDESWGQSMKGSPYVSMPPEQLKKLPLGHRAGFLLSRMDGTMDIETLIEVAAMPRAEALRLMRDLYESGVVLFR